MDARIYSEERISSIRSHLEKSGSKHITYPKFIFLCGRGIDRTVEDSYRNSNRGITQDYLEKLLPDVNFVLSEQIWEDGFDENIDLLTFEEFLAEVSDAIILFVESPGSFCELGAFAYADKLFSDKLMVVIDEKRRQERSFIIAGPTAKAKHNGAQVVYAPVESGALLSSRELRGALEALVKTLSSKRAEINLRNINESEDRVYISSFIVELLELLRIVQPISRTDLLQLYKAVKGFDSFRLVKRNGERFSSEIKFGYILKLLRCAGVLRDDDDAITLADHRKTQNLMLSYSGNAMERERNRLLCRKYRYGEKI